MYNTFLENCIKRKVKKRVRRIDVLSLDTKEFNLSVELDFLAYIWQSHCRFILKYCIFIDSSIIKLVAFLKYLA